MSEIKFNLPWRATWRHRDKWSIQDKSGHIVLWGLDENIATRIAACVNAFSGKDPIGYKVEDKKVATPDDFRRERIRRLEREVASLRSRLAKARDGLRLQLDHVIMIIENWYGNDEDLKSRLENISFSLEQILPALDSEPGRAMKERGSDAKI